MQPSDPTAHEKHRWIEWSTPCASKVTTQRFTRASATVPDLDNFITRHSSLESVIGGLATLMGLANTKSAYLGNRHGGQTKTNNVYDGARADAPA